MRRRPRLTLGRIIEHMATLCAPRHRELVGAMVAELDSIADPAERRRFAAGAIAAILRLAVKRIAEAAIDMPGRLLDRTGSSVTTELRGSSMPEISTRWILGRHVTPFAITFGLMTALLLADVVVSQLPRLSARGESTGTLVEVLLLATPSAVALTVPMTVFLAVSWVFSRLGREGILSAARREPHGVRRLVAPVLGAAAVIAALMFVSNDQILPRTNARFASVLADAPVRQTDRSMTIGQMREAARSALVAGGPNATARAVEYEVEIQKKFALAAACIILALAAAMIAFRFPRGGTGLVIGASAVVFLGYYVSLIAGESLADQQVISPIVGMWMANAGLLAVALLLFRRPGGPDAESRSEPLAASG